MVMAGGLATGAAQTPSASPVAGAYVPQRVYDTRRATFSDFEMMAAEPISSFVHRHPTVKMLALSFLLLIGMSLLLEGFGQHIPKGYIYFAMGFSVFVEVLNIRVRKGEPVKLHRPYPEPAS